MVEKKDKKTEEALDTAKPRATDKPKAVAKAGKRSQKAIKEVESKEAKAEKKLVTKSSSKPKPAVKPPRTKLERAGKKYQQAAKQIDRQKNYSLAEAVEMALKSSTTNFDATLELHINLAVDPKQADQNIRGVVVLPHGSGKKIMVAAFVDGDDQQKAKAAGADIAGIDEVTTLLDKNQTPFDMLIATPTVMAQLGKYAKILGPKGLMPNPKSGTVTADVAKAVKEAKAGRVEYRVDPSGIVHLGIGKVSFGLQKTLDNAQAIVDSLKAAKPASVKGAFIKSAYVTTSMGPSVKTEL